MKSMFMNIGGPVHPRSKSRAVVRSLVRSPRSRWPTPSGPSVAAISRSLSTRAEVVAEQGADDLVERRGDLRDDEHDAERHQGCGQVGAVLDAPDEEPGGDRQARRGPARAPAGSATTPRRTRAPSG